MPANLKKVLVQYTDARKLEEKTTMRRKIAMAMVGLLVGSGAAAAAHAADAAAGKALYEKSCAGCHGPDGKGNQKMATILGEKGLNIVGKDTAKKSDDQLLKIISEGAGKMPAAKLTRRSKNKL
jgi:mono/diheme cytochrome c family protein